MSWWLYSYLIFWQRVNSRFDAGTAAAAVVTEISIALEISFGLPTLYFIEQNKH